MDVKVTEKDNREYLVSISGRFNTDNAYLVDSELSKIIAKADTITIDFDKLEYISSAGLRVLLTNQKRMKNPISIINASDDVYEIFEITGFSDIVNISRKE